MPRLSVIIIAKDESRDIRDCLESIKWADEIVVLDSGSQDATISICREYTDKVYENQDWQGFGVQKNRVLSCATGDWVLSLDADERVSSALGDEIRRAIEMPNAPAVFEMPRLSSFCGRFMHHSGWWPDYVPRLFKRGQAQFSDDLVHERLVFAGVAGRLDIPLRHVTYHDLAEVLAKVNSYSSLGADNLQRAGKKGGLRRAVGHGVWAFVRTYVLRAGFLDGREGFMLAVANAEATYYRYLKLYYLSVVPGHDS
jgi:glycosyltransferase involved in cell wall biosynthesis